MSPTERSALDRWTLPELRWLWEQLGATADRRGDPSLTSGPAVSITAPDSPEERGAASGLLGGRLRAGQRRRVELEVLATQLAPNTPGEVIAHALGRPLAIKAKAKAERAEAEAHIHALMAKHIPTTVTDDAWRTLRRTGWIARLVASDNLETTIGQCRSLLGALPNDDALPVDRRRLASEVTGDPHGLDQGRQVAGFSLAVLAATGQVGAGLPVRGAWRQAGVVCDDIVGGLTMVGMSPLGWTVPPGAPVTIPPRVLADCDWPAGEGHSLFVTENPSVLSAASTIPGACVCCLAGTPSAVEVQALARMAGKGWRLLVRADFDDAGIRHVRAVLEMATASPWRMGSSDYLEGLEESRPTTGLRLDRLGPTPWDLGLAETMREHSLAVFEEAFMESLQEDIENASKSDGR